VKTAAFLMQKLEAGVLATRNLLAQSAIKIKLLPEMYIALGKST
jgi:hypothetical protein